MKPRRTSGLRALTTARGGHSRASSNAILKACLLLLTLAVGGGAASADSGHDLWLRMKKSDREPKVTPAKTLEKSAVVKTAVKELKEYWHGGDITMETHCGKPACQDKRTESRDKGKALLNSDDGYSITRREDGTVGITASNDRGLLYGAYALLRMQQTGKELAAGEELSSHPSASLRILNHWDNPDGTIERGYSGHSIFWKPGSTADISIIKEYGRANASIGINATVLNNVNAKPAMLGKEKLRETQRIADALRPYGIRVFLAVNFASPKALGKLPTADPLDPAVRKWWQRKAEEIYRMIPDFGGFLVKANSEGEPGPMDYGRSHAEGANMLAKALKPFGGIVMWRAFVYSPQGGDRASQAYNEFVPLDGSFDDNVVLQIKNGPIDFQPREPVSPAFFGMKRTDIMPEFQITQEYTGESIHTCFLASMWREFFDVMKLNAVGFDAIAAVANIGDSRNWCGSDMAQANWYAFGRMAWDASLTPKAIAEEWLKQTYSTEKPFVEAVSRLLCLSHEATVRYMMPLGLHHIFAGGHHYGPEPWCDPEGWREDWKPKYYHRADTCGIGFNRTDGRDGSQNTLQYPDSLYYIYNKVETCPEQLLLWFHHVPWTHRMHSGETLWEALCHTYDQGVREAEAFSTVWKAMRHYVDAERHEAQQKLFDRQAKDAWWWRDACLLYFQQFSRQPLPLDCPKPRHSLTDLMSYKLVMDNYTTADIDKLP